MKQFLYLDTDIVDSILAQKQKGLIKESSREQQQSGSTADGTTSTLGVTGGIDASLFNLFHSQAQGNKDDTNTSEISSHWAYRNIITKTLHDAAFDMALDYIKPTDSLDSVHLGMYVELKKEFVFSDFRYLESFVSEKGLYQKMLKIQSPDKNKTGNSASKKTSQNHIDKETKELRDNVALVTGIVPYDRMLCSDDGFIVPLENRYFRVSPEGMAFKYGGIITCVGMITNIISKGRHKAQSTLFSTIQDNINDTLFGILEVKQDKIIVVHPIAVYYEE